MQLGRGISADQATSANSGTCDSKTWRSSKRFVAFVGTLLLLTGCASAASTASDDDDPVQEHLTAVPAATNEDPDDPVSAAGADTSIEANDAWPAGSDPSPVATGSGDDYDPSENGTASEQSDQSDAPAPVSVGANRATQYTHVDDFDLGFKNARIDLAEAELLFDTLGDGDDIPESFDNLLASADHDLQFDDVGPVIEAELPAGLGDAIDVFVLLSSKYGLIGCEAHLRGQDAQDWNDNLFGYLLEQAADLPADQRNNQAGLLVIGANVASSQLCPRLQNHS